MLPAKLAIACVLAALLLCACGSAAKPQAGADILHQQKALGRGVVDSPLARHMSCLRQLGLPMVTRGTTDAVLGPASAQARITFTSTPGAAQQAQISGAAPGAETIGSALLFPGSMGDDELKKVEKCLAQNVKG